MTIFLYVLSVINILFSIISAIPCLMAGVMSMDSPQAQKDPLAIFLCLTILTFPVVCFLCGIFLPILAYFKQYILGLIIGFFPIIEAVSVILFMFIMDSGK